jgi:hypothetical protein
VILSPPARMLIELLAREIADELLLGNGPETQTMPSRDPCPALARREENAVDRQS